MQNSALHTALGKLSAEWVKKYFLYSPSLIVVVNLGKVGVKARRALKSVEEVAKSMKIKLDAIEAWQDEVNTRLSNNEKDWY